MNNLKYILVLPLLLFSLLGNAQTNSFAQNVLDEVNFLRSNPFDYAEKRLKVEAENHADNGAYRFLKKMKPVKVLVLNKTLGELATEYAKLLSKKSSLSHTYKGDPMKRANKAGYFGMVGENLAAGNDPILNADENPQESAIEFVKMLVIDNGVKDLGHRKILVEPRFSELGVGFYHDTASKMKNFFVQEFGNRK